MRLLIEFSYLINFRIGVSFPSPKKESQKRVFHLLGNHWEQGIERMGNKHLRQTVVWSNEVTEFVQ